MLANDQLASGFRRDVVKALSYRTFRLDEATDLTECVPVPGRYLESRERRCPQRWIVRTQDDRNYFFRAGADIGIGPLSIPCSLRAFFERAVSEVDKHLDAAAIDATVSAGAKMQGARTAAEASVRLLEGNSLDGIGTDQWKAMWEKARAYSDEVAYPDHAFPHVEGEAICVLCEQPLTGVTAQRMTSLEHFVADSSQAEPDARKAEHAHWNSIIAAALAASSFEVSPELLGLAIELEIELAELSGTALEAATVLLAQHAGVREGEILVPGSAADRNGDRPAPMGWDRGALDEAIVKMRVDLTDRRERLTESQDRTKQQANADRIASLRERKAVSSADSELTALEALTKSIVALTAAQATCTTRAATELSGKLSEGLVTEALRNGLAEELSLLGADRLTVSVAKDTAKVVSAFRLKLTTVAGDPLVGDVLSEGELRVLSLAAFLMEIRLTGGVSAIVFDDPVSSLDHLYREKVASRIALESTRRQVIVFTHDLVFLDELAEATRLAGQRPNVTAIKLTAHGTGVISRDLPAAGGDFKTQLAHIDANIASSKAVWETQDAELWDPISRHIVGDLRKAWERGVEEVLFSKVVTRFRASVMTQSLREVHVHDDLWTEVEGAMSELSGKGPHDAAMSQLRTGMSYPELLGAVGRLRAWKAAVLANRKETSERRESLIPRAIS